MGMRVKLKDGAKAHNSESDRVRESSRRMKRAKETGDFHWPGRAQALRFWATQGLFTRNRPPRQVVAGVLRGLGQEDNEFK